MIERTLMSARYGIKGRVESMLNFELENHKPLREIVYEQLKFQILKGKIKPGTRMMEVELAEDMGVSRTPVREAIRKLEKEALVVIEPRKGAYVSGISVKEMLDTLVVREELEALAASLAAKRVTEEELDDLDRNVRQYTEANASGAMDKIIHADESFHRKIVGLSGNKALIQLFESVQELSLRFRYLYYEDFSRYENMPVEHKKIVEAIRSGDSDAARTMSDNHVKKLKDFVVREGESAFGSREDGEFPPASREEDVL